MLIQFQPHFPRSVHFPALFLSFHTSMIFSSRNRISDFPCRRLSLALLRVVIRRHGKIQDRTDRLDAKPVPVRVNELD